ncbi:protein kinase [Streptomyces gilvosporeus]|uniref:Protein kinase domain-containing protein n=1 Tax=Streptomyces gilvosporeus TaxID=553510 RepID=A0A1V0TSX8_9ACTN|nr:protein kinase [Streptomyces gilvosporeus]ARF55858.1 hypothetical protein B1H19_18205 [Streptomyces gilvosporeus]
MDEYAGRVLAERYRLPLRPPGEDDVVETRAFDTYSGQEVLLRQVPLPEVVEAEFLGGPETPAGTVGPTGAGTGAADRSPGDPVVRRALDAATAAARLPDHPLLDQVFDVFAQDGSLWIVGELIRARPLSALLVEGPLSPHRAAEIAADVLTALRALHAHGWLHRNITARTVLVCDDGRAVLTGLAVGAAQEALCGYDVIPGDDTSEALAAAHPEPADLPAPRRAPHGENGLEAEPGDGPGADLGGEPGVRLTKTAPTGLAAERAGQTRLQIVGPVTERWAPEQTGWIDGREWSEGEWTEGEWPEAEEPEPEAGEPLTDLPRPRVPDSPLPDPHPVGPQLADTSDQLGPAAPGSATPGPAPATDLWAVGALLFRSVQGHAPFPEESAAELARLVRSQPPAPAPADVCGEDLPPLIAALLRRDPARRPGIEELRDRLRALIRMAPEPEVGRSLVTVPALEQGGDPRRLPIVRRRGELVRRGRRKKDRLRQEQQPRRPQTGRPAAPPQAAPVPRPRPPRATKPPKPPKPLRRQAMAKPPRSARSSGQSSLRGDLSEDQQLLVQVGLETSARQSRSAWDEDDARPPGGRGPRHLGRLLLALVMVLLVGAVAFVMVFLPKSGEEAQGGPGGSQGTGVSGAASGGTQAPTDGQGTSQGQDQGQDGGPGGTQAPRPTPPVAPGYTLRNDPEGFQVAVRQGAQRRAKNAQGQVRYLDGDYELLIVPGRDTTAHFGADPMAYQLDKEGELAPSRASGWSSSSGLRRVDVGKTAMAEGTFTWSDSSGRKVYVRNLAMIHNGRYHLVLVIGPDTDRREVDRRYEQATSTYDPR